MNFATNPFSNGFNHQRAVGANPSSMREILLEAKRAFAPLFMAGVLLGLLALSTGCSTFKRDWEQARSAPVDPQDITGAWDGQWHSSVNRHHGRLQCLMTRMGQDRYQARFRGTFGKIFHASYTVPLSVQQNGDKFRLQGEADLGSLAGGLYRYDGQATPTNLTATYSSKYDRGVFELVRP